jgi:hypothetical protein
MRKLILLFLACWLPSYGAIGGNTQWDVRTTGSDSANGGGFDPGNANFATDLACTSATTSAPVCSSASYNFVSGDVGALLFVQAGTSWIPGWYPIASVASNAATVTASVGSVTAYQTVNGPLGLSATLGIASTASPTVGTWGIDYSQQSSPQFAYTDLVIGSTTTQYVSVLHPVGKNLVGNILRTTSGTNCTSGVNGQREVVSTSGTTATVDSSLGTAASVCSAGLGGAKATVCGTYSSGCQTGATASATTYNQIFIQAGTYNIGTVTIKNQNSGNSNLVISYLGYGTYHGDLGTKPVFTTASNTPIFIIANAQTTEDTAIYNLTLTTSDTSYTQGLLDAYLTSSPGLQIVNCKFDLTALTSGSGSAGAVFSNPGQGNNIAAIFYNNEFTGTTYSNGIVDLGGNNVPIIMEWNYFHGLAAGVWDNNTGANQRWLIKHNVFANNTRGVYQQAAGGFWLEIEGNDFYNQTSENVKFNNQALYWITAANNIMYGGTYGFYVPTSAPGLQMIMDNAFGGVSTANYNAGVGWQTSALNGGADVALGSCQPFSAPSSGDFSLSTCGKAALAAKGFPGVTPFGTGYLDIGALQSKAAAPTAPTSHPFLQ